MTLHDHVNHDNFVNMIKSFKISHFAFCRIQGIIFNIFEKITTIE